MESMSYKEELRTVSLASLEKRKLRDDLAVCKTQRRVDGGASLCSLVTNDKTCRNGIKLHQGRFRLDIRKKLFTVRVVKHWKWLPKKMLDASCLSVFKKYLDNAFNNMLTFSQP